MGEEAPDLQALLREATDKHKRGLVEEAIPLYRRVLAAKDDHQAAILLANLLFTSRPPTPMQAVSRRAEALALADHAVAHADELAAPKDRALLLARYGYFTLQAHNIHAADGDDGDDGAEAAAAKGVHTADPASPLGRAIAALERAVQLDPAITIAWRNLSMCYKSLARFEESEAMMARAVDAAGGRVNADLLYRHAKALKRVRRDADAAGRYCDVLAADPRHALSAFWLKVMLASPDKHPALHAGAAGSAVRGRMLAAIAAFEAAAASGGGGDGGSSGGGDAPPAVPHEYIRKLFDGYSHKFDAHLVTALHYRTPAALLALALEAVAAHPDRPARLSPTAPAVAWECCGDLGCGTGLAGVEFRPYVAHLTGVDLSGGMVGEARRRRRRAAAPAVAGAAPAAAGGSSPPPQQQQQQQLGQPLYDALDVDEVEAWLLKQAGVVRAATAAGDGGPEAAAAAAAAAATVAGCESAPHRPYDLLVCADVLVYIGALEGCFAAAAGAMAPTGAAGRGVATPSLFVLSTECEPEEEGWGEGGGGGGPRPGFRLTGTGRCSHRRSYVLACAAAAGFRLLLDRRQPIRKNAGADVTGDLYVFERV